MIERYFAVDMPAWRFLLNTLAVSCLALLPLLLLYVWLTPGFGSLLLDNGLAMGRFLRQVVTNGFLVVFTINYLGFFLYAALIARYGRIRASARILLIDPPSRVVVFVFLHALIYFFSADWFGSFGGDHWLALRVVGPTLARSALFANLSGVYFYATLGSAFPVYRAAIGRLIARNAHRGTWFAPLVNALPRPWAPIVLALALFAVSALLLTGVAAAITYLQAL